MQQSDDREPKPRWTSVPDSPAQDSLADLFTRYHHEVFRLCLGMLGERQEAEDATQEVFLRAQRGWAGYNPQLAAPRTWLGHISINYCRSLLRRRQIWQQIQRIVAPVAPQHIHQREAKLDMLAALHQLDTIHRGVILLRYYLDLSCSDIAHVLDIPEGTVRSRLSYARRKLRNYLEGDQHDTK
ncbi:MAG: RNA polymerase sigma factor [Roseiflexaceae bacterium]|nr:RNA polymerase sigma factor [Roseiflexaceae bacterium]